MTRAALFAACRLSETMILSREYSRAQAEAIAAVLHYHPRHVCAVLKNGGASFIFAERLMKATGAPFELFYYARADYRALKASRDAPGRASATAQAAPMPSKPLRLVTQTVAMGSEAQHSSAEPIQTRARRYRKPGPPTLVVN